MPPPADHLSHLLLGHRVVVGESRLGRHRLPAQSGQTALRQLPLHGPLGLGPVGLAGLGHHPQQGRYLHSIRGWDAVPSAVWPTRNAGSRSVSQAVSSIISVPWVTTKV